MDAPRYAITPTAFGAFGVAWRHAGIARTWMHERTVEATRRQILRTFPDATEGAPTAEVERAMSAVAQLLERGRGSISIGLDLGAIPEFDRRVYAVAREIPAGETMTYGAVARALGEEPMRARDVGVALARNPFAPIVPCHRIVAANGRLGGYSAPGGTSTKRRLLELEGAAIVAAPAQQALFDWSRPEADLSP